jgi:hypothetical protein
MKNTADFLNLPLVNVVANTPGARVVQTVEVPNRKMYAVVVAVPVGESGAELHFFGVRKSDGLITTRFDIPVTRNIQTTSLGDAPTLSPEKIARWERTALRIAANNRLARNFFRRVVKTRELLDGGLTYYGTQTETQFVWELTEEINKLNSSNLAGRKNTFPEWTGKFRFDLDGVTRTAARCLKYNPETKLVSARYTFFGGDKANFHLIHGTIQQNHVELGHEIARLDLVGVYADGNWEKADVFVRIHEGILRSFYQTFPMK